MGPRRARGAGQGGEVRRRAVVVRDRSRPPNPASEAPSVRVAPLCTSTLTTVSTAGGHALVPRRCCWRRRATTRTTSSRRCALWSEARRRRIGPVARTGVAVPTGRAARRCKLVGAEDCGPNTVKVMALASPLTRRAAQRGRDRARRDRRADKARLPGAATLRLGDAAETYGLGYIPASRTADAAALFVRRRPAYDAYHQ